MRYGDEDRESENVEDRRGQEGRRRFPFPGGGRGIQIPIGGGGMSLTTLLIIGAIMLFLGINPLDLLRGDGTIQFPQVPQLPQSEPSSGRPAKADRPPFDIPGLPGSKQAAPAKPSEDEMVRFTKRVLADTEDVWKQVFQGFGNTYRAPVLVLYREGTTTRCGPGDSAMGPFYCPLDQKIYVDLAFYEELKRRFNVSGDFAQAYVLAHEVGHHVQKQLGIADKVQEIKEGLDTASANALQVRMELQADCFAGVWANLNDQLKGRLQEGDVEEGLNAASQIGDDMIQKRMQGRVVPDAFTHGTSEQRQTWFKKGLQAGDINVCETFKADL